MEICTLTVSFDPRHPGDAVNCYAVNQHILPLTLIDKRLAEIDMEQPLWGAPCAVDGVLYLSTSRRVFAIAEPAAKSAASSSGER